MTNPTQTKQAETYERITAMLLGAIERDGLLPWQKPWSGAKWARSMSTGREYSGINRWTLTALTEATLGYSPWWGTFKQIQAQGGQVNKGEKGTTIFHWSFFNATDKVTGNVKSIPSLRVFYVFNYGQATGLPAKFSGAAATDENIELAEPQQVFDGYVGREEITVRHGGDRACYSPANDVITVPHLGDFTNSPHFYAVLFHEAGHSTGAAKRLNREGITNFDKFGSHQYSREEMIAELSSALVCGHLGIHDATLLDSQAAYLKNWAGALKGDPGAFMWAASRAEKAANLILGTVAAEVVEDDKVLVGAAA